MMEAVQQATSGAKCCCTAAGLLPYPLSEVSGVSKMMGSLQPVIVPLAVTSGGIVSIITPSALAHSRNIPSSDLACSSARQLGHGI